MSRRSLVLNASYEPLMVVPIRRAVILVMAEKADLVIDTGLVLHGERLAVPVPSVLRLRTFVHVPYSRRAALSRRGVMARDGGRCQYCGARADSIDHVVPRSKGGPHTWDNVVAACRPCNTSKRDRLLHETSMRLHTHPRQPVGRAWSIMAEAGSVPSDWAKYLTWGHAEAAADQLTG
jgi:5-methylcytosine-specific restriction endonuclease McrA